MFWMLPVAALAAAPAPQSSAAAPVPIACIGEDAPAGAECFTVAVPEKRGRSATRMLGLNVLRLPASSSPGRRAIFIFQGGPGQAATKLADFYARTYAGARATHDIVLIDQRGTGGSNPLSCDFGGSAARPQPYFADLFDPGTIRACRRALEGRADLTAYTTAAAVADADAVRGALGYAAIDLYGTSYGTRVAMEYARRHPRRVRTMTLKGVVHPTAAAPGDFAANVERSVALMVRDCRNEPACAAAYPSPGDELRAAARRLEGGAVEVALAGGERVRLSRGLFGAVVRTMLQATSLRAELPSLVHAAAGGDFAPFVSRALELRRAAQSEIATGLMLSVLCAEDLPYLDRAAARRTAAGTILGSYWVDQAAAACGLWPRGAVAADWRRPYRVAAPTLIVSGDLDPATPPAAGEAVRRYLARSVHAVAPGGSHSFSGMTGCIDIAMSAFVTAGRLDAVDAKCAAKIAPPPFKVAGEN